jgi:hypothetical protein
MLLAAIVGWGLVPASPLRAHDGPTDAAAAPRLERVPILREAQARFHDQRARGYYQVGRYRDALNQFFAAQRIAPTPRTAFNIGLCFQQLGDRESEFLAFSEYLSLLEPGDEDAGRRERAVAILERLEPEVARVRVETVPPGAEIFVDDAELGSYGRAPRLLAVAPGSRRIEAVLRGYRPASVRVDAVPGREVEVTLSLEARTGQIVLNATPAGRAVVSDGEGRVVLEAPTPVDAPIPIGAYGVRIEADGFQTRRDLVRVEEGRTARRSFRLQPLPTRVGSVAVAANELDAVVVLNGESVGFPPLVVSELPVGSHRLELTAPGLDPFAETIDVRPSSQTWVTVTMAPERDVTHSAGTWLLGGTGVAALAAAGVVGALAWRNDQDLDEARRAGDVLEEIDLQDRQRRLNVATDALWIGGALAVVTALVLYLIEDAAEPPRSTATLRWVESP